MPDVLVLCYHGVSDRWPSSLAVTPADLRGQVTGLLRAGFRPTTFSQAVSGRVRGRALAVTFDDAFASVGALGFPVLAELEVPATVFVPTAFPGTAGPMRWPGIEQDLGGPHEAELTCMGWDKLRALGRAGWEVGSHTVTHPHLPQLDDRALEEELVASRVAVERGMDAPCPSIAYPYGAHDARVVAAAGRAGYAAAATLPSRWHRAQPLRWPRVGVYRRDDRRRVARKTSPTVRRARRMLQV